MKDTPFPRIVIRRSCDRAIAGRHPWILSTAIQDQSSVEIDGKIVDVHQSDGRWIGRGIANETSRIRIRVYSWNPEEQIDSAWIRRRLSQATELRGKLLKGHANEAQRLVFSEADQLSGLIVDRYADYLVLQQTAAAMNRFLPDIVEHFVDHFGPKGILLRIDDRTAKAEGLEAGQKILHGQFPSEPIEIEDNGLRWQIDLGESQKTGYYLDQRENRRIAANWVPQGGRVLDVCCYLGGFALSIARWSEPKEVLAIDTSARAIESARFHAELNGIRNVRFEVNDFYRSLESLVASGEKFDLIVLDPPRMAGSRNQVEAALRAYHRLNFLGVQLLSPGGILVTCSCSGRVHREDFQHMLMGVSRHSGREIQILERRGAAADHPSCVSCPETDYLKCFICRVL